MCFRETLYERTMVRYGLIVVIGSERRRTYPCRLREKAREIGVVLETKLTGNLLNALRGIGQFTLHPQHDCTLDIFAGAMADGGGENLVQIACGDVQAIGIERWLAMAGDMFANELDESQQHLAMSWVQAVGIVILAHHFGKDVDDGTGKILRSPTKPSPTSPTIKSKCLKTGGVGVRS